MQTWDELPVARGDEPLHEGTHSRNPPEPAARKRISLIGVYFGGFPAIWPLYFKSAGFNRHIEFLVFTDQEPPSPLPANVRFIKMDQQAFEREASRKLGHRMRLAFPRKLCDYKPAYGLIFSDYLRHCDYWGHIDFDFVWGNISSYLQEPLGKGYQVISADGRRVSGPFTIYANNHQLTLLFCGIPHLISKLNAADSFDLDERDFDLLVKTSGATLVTRAFRTLRKISRQEFKEFLDNEAVYEQILWGLRRTEETGKRLPALWRKGEVWNCLPWGTTNQIRLVNSMFLHLPRKRVSFTVDFKNDLILPAEKQNNE